MSAIFGIINKRGGAVAIDCMNQMLSAIKHRSVDGNNIWSNDNVSLGHCLLKIYPQQEFEKQPLSIQSCCITADARLDNREQLASLLKINNRPLRETTDPEIIILAYKQWGEECVNYLDGEFAFVIWDLENHKLFAAVDKIGFRPLFYYDSPELFIFCSEIKGVVAAKPNPNYFNEDSLVEYFYRKGAPNNTFNQEIFSLCGGNVLSLKDDRLTIRKYWNLTKTGTFSFKKDEEWYECARELIYKAVEKRLNPNITTGITLSGGLDSTAIACILSDILKKKNKPLYAFSSVLPIDYQ
jgi:asparagine synthase (glutamine-hydrolysing)